MDGLDSIAASSKIARPSPERVRVRVKVRADAASASAAADHSCVCGAQAATKAILMIAC